MMIKSAYRLRFKKIAIAVLMLTFASWSHEGFVICYGADGHVEIERPSDRDCCKSAKKCVPTSLSELSETAHCIDIPIGAAQYLVSTSHSASFHNTVIPLSAVAPLLFPAHRPCPAVHNHAIPPPYNPLLSSLKTVILLI
jgi:hypothetical protein